MSERRTQLGYTIKGNLIRILPPIIHDRFRVFRDHKNASITGEQQLADTMRFHAQIHSGNTEAQIIFENGVRDYISGEAKRLGLSPEDAIKEAEQQSP